MMMNNLGRIVLLVAVFAATATAFTTPTTVNKQVVRPTTTAVFVGTVPDERDLEISEDVGMVPLVLKMAGILTIKTAKDIINYPPMLFDTFTRQVSGKDETNPATFVAKLMGVLIFKAIHDAVYFPMIWSQRMIQCQSLEECDVDRY